MEPLEVTDVDLTFGGGMEKLLPPYEEIPEEFRSSKTEWNRIVSQWFFGGLPQGTEFIPKEGIDSNKAIRHIKTILHSFQPKHEHKEAGCAFLLSKWFTEIKIPPEQKGE